MAITGDTADLGSRFELEGRGRLCAGDDGAEFLCEVSYRIHGWRELHHARDKVVEGLAEIQGVLQRTDGGMFFEEIGRDDLLLDLQRDHLWWPCLLQNNAGRALNRDGRGIIRRR